MFSIAYRLSLRHKKPILVETFSRPSPQRLDARLILGASIFGIGWGLSGFCPGPAIVSAAFGEPRVWAFLGAMVTGMLLYDRFRRRQ